jgi:hypothetical protein
LRKKEDVESKKKWIGKADFKKTFGKNNTCLKFTIPLIHTTSPQISHSYRDYNKSKWVDKKNFII